MLLNIVAGWDRSSATGPYSKTLPSLMTKILYKKIHKKLTIIQIKKLITIYIFVLAPIDMHNCLFEDHGLDNGIAGIVYHRPPQHY